MARDSTEAALIASGPLPGGAAGEAPPPPQLYSAPDPEEDPEAQVSGSAGWLFVSCHLNCTNFCVVMSPPVYEVEFCCSRGIYDHSLAFVPTLNL